MHIKIISLYKTEQEAFMVFDINTLHIFLQVHQSYGGNSMIQIQRFGKKKSEIYLRKG